MIEKKLTVFLTEYEKVNDNIIYLCDVEVEIFKVKILKYQKKRTSRIEIIRNTTYEKNPGEQNKNGLINHLSKIFNKSEDETIEIGIITIKKELSCSLYKR